MEFRLHAVKFIEYRVNTHNCLYFLSAASCRAAADYILGYIIWLSVCLSVINLCKQDISKIVSDLAKFIAATLYIGLLA